MRRFLDVSVSWERVSPESAEQGDADARGFVIRGLEFEIGECTGEPVLEAYSASEALREIRDRGCTAYVSVSSRGATFSPTEAQHTDYSDGSETTYSVHVEGPERLIRALVRAVNVAHPSHLTEV